MPKADKPYLKGLHILVTRPADQAQQLIDAINQYGGEAELFPLLETTLSQTPPEAFGRLGDFDMLIFVSRSAARFAMAFLADGIPESIPVAVVGAGTRQELVRHGRYPDIMPVSRYDSEGLLELDDLNAVEGKNILIVRGQEGREILRETLMQRGANVSYAEVYQRKLSEQPLTDRQLQCNRIVITSSQALDHLLGLAREAGLEQPLLEHQLVVIHPRIAERVNELGFKVPPLVAEQASDSGILKALSSNRT